MRKSWKRSLPRFLIFFFSIAIPLLLVAHFEILTTLDASRASMARQGLAAAKLGATAVDEYLRGCGSYIEAYSRNPTLLDGMVLHDPGRVAAVLAELARHNGRVDRAFVTDPQGVEWCDYPHEPAVIGRSFAFRDWFQGVSRAESTYVSSVYRRAAGRQERTIAIATPLRAGGRLRGYLVVHALVSSLERRLAQTPAPRFGELIVLDRGDAVVTGADSSGASAIRESLTVVLDRCRHGVPVQWSKLAHRPHVVAYADIPALGGSVVALRDLETTVASERAVARTIYLLAIAVALLLALILCWILELKARRIREKVEAPLRESERRFRATFEQAAVGIAHFAADGRMLRVNQKLCEILGYRREELLTRSLPELIRFRGPDEPDGIARQDLAQLRNWGGGIYRAEQELVRSDQSHVWCQITVAPVLGEEEEPEYYTGVVEDISERKRLEEQFLQSQKMRAIGQLAGGIAHDFNNLLTTILGYCELLERRLPEGAPYRTYVEEICKAGERASSLTAQLLAFSRKQILKPSLLDLNEVVGGVEQLLRRLIDHHVALETNLEPGLGAIRADRGQIEQVLMNLVVNARDAMPGGGRIVLETASESVDEPSAGDGESGPPPGEYVTVTVTDTGTGMDEATRAQLFEPFFTTKEKGKGTGLGLSTVYGIVKQSGGAITVWSEPGRGSSFRVYLPRSEAEPARIEPEPPLEIVGRATERDFPPGGSETILLVEDDEVLRGLTRGVLEEAGYHVLEAESGNDALATCEPRQSRIHLVITDVAMPGMSGTVLVRRARALHPEMKVIYTSGFTDEAAHGEIDRAMAFLQKPYTPASLLETVRSTLGAPAAAHP